MAWAREHDELLVKLVGEDEGNEYGRWARVVGRGWGRWPNSGEGLTEKAAAARKDQLRKYFAKVMGEGGRLHPDSRAPWTGAQDRRLKGLIQGVGVGGTFPWAEWSKEFATTRRASSPRAAASLCPICAAGSAGAGTA